MAALIVYGNDIVVTGTDQCEINNLKGFLSKKFEIEDLGLLRYFLGIEVARSKDEISLSQCKYVLDLLQYFGMLRCRPCKIPIESNHCLQADGSHRIIDIG